MTARVRKVTVRLTESELVKLRDLVKRSGYSQEAYLRSIIAKIIPPDKPPSDYHAMVRELSAIGNNLNQIAARANSLGVIDAKRYDEQTEALSVAVAKIGRIVREGRRL